MNFQQMASNAAVKLPAAPSALKRWNLKCEACGSFKVVDTASYPFAPAASGRS